MQLELQSARQLLDRSERPISRTGVALVSLVRAAIPSDMKVVLPSADLECVSLSRCREPVAQQKG
eukprot:6614199-Prymnesium_polylepis.1